MDRPTNNKMIPDHGEKRPGDVALSVEGLPNTHESLGKNSMVVYACNPSTQEVRPQGSEIKGYPWLHDELKASLGYMGTLFQKKKKKAKEGCGEGSVGKSTCQTSVRTRVWTSGSHVKPGCSSVHESANLRFLWGGGRRGQERLRSF